MTTTTTKPNIYQNNKSAPTDDDNRQLRERKRKKKTSIFRQQITKPFQAGRMTCGNRQKNVERVFNSFSIFI